MNDDGARRALTFERWFNVRDLGGLPTASGGTTGAGRLFRAAAPGRLTETDRARAQALGIRTVIDLRSDSEEEARVHPLTAMGAEHRRASLQVTLEEMDERAGREYSPERYLLYLDTGPEGIRDLFTWLGDEATYPAVVHCVGGTHRTAIVTALALDLLGVPRDAIEADYQMSGPEVERVLAFWAKRGWFSDASDAQTDQIVGVHPGVISGFLDAVDARYGSSEGYLLSIVVSPEAIAGFRRAMAG